MACLSVSAAIINLGRKGLISVPHHSPSLRNVRTVKQGRNLKTGAVAEAMEECFLLFCSPRLAQPVHLRITLPGVVPSTMG